MLLRGKKVIKDDPKDHFTKIPNSLLKAKNLTAMDFRVICYLYSVSAKWTLAYTRMAKDFGCDKKTIISSWKRLIGKGIIIDTDKHYQIDLSKLEFDKTKPSKKINESSVNDSGSPINNHVNPPESNGGEIQPSEESTDEKIIHPISENIPPDLVENFPDIGGENPSNEKDLYKDLEKYFDNNIVDYTILSGNSLYFALNIYLPKFKELNCLGEYLISIYEDEFPNSRSFNKLTKGIFIFESIYMYYTINVELPTYDDIDYLRKAFKKSYNSFPNPLIGNTSSTTDRSLNGIPDQDLLSINQIEINTHSINQNTEQEFIPLEINEFINQIYTPNITSIEKFRDYLVKALRQLLFEIRYFDLDNSIRDSVFQKALQRFYNEYHSLPQLGDMFSFTAFRFEFGEEINLHLNKNIEV